MMLKKTAKLQFLFASLSIVAIVSILSVSSCSADGNQDPNVEQQQGSTKEPNEKPMIIWFHNGVTDRPEALNVALSSGLITHVMIKYMHRADANWRKKAAVRQAIEIVKHSKAKLIWSRNLWPYYNNENIRTESLFDPNYYIGEIRELRAEANEMDANSVALDTEAYGHSPMRAFMKKEIILRPKDIERLKFTIKKVVDVVGKVDFIYPAGWPGNRMPYDTIADLGTCRISESTFYDNYERIEKIKTPYEIFGAYVNTVRKNKKHPHLPFFMVSEIFEKSHLWSKKRGLFLYPKERNALAVAKELAAYARTLPYKNESNKDLKLK